MDQGLWELGKELRDCDGLDLNGVRAASAAEIALQCGVQTVLEK